MEASEVGPALGLLELSSIAVGIRVGDCMVKRAPVAAIVAGTIHPGRFLVLVTGAVADVEEALAAGAEDADPGTVCDRLFLPDAHPAVARAAAGRRHHRDEAAGEAVGIVETRTVAALLAAADRGLKAAEVSLAELRAADDLGGKAYCLFQGAVADVEAAVEAAAAPLSTPVLVARVVVPRLHPEMRAELAADPRFLARLGREPG